ncbi:hypothetical protein PaeBR_02020 [Paenibacillus sp. BR2-3]|uniref:hypothetical protein n=1 Tax=Paenibacillus sp. BR2-3 TaxID=3048494 RepID=UPI0039775365
MSGRLDAQSTVKNAKDFVLFIKYLSFDEDFGKEGEELLTEADKELDGLLESETIPENLLHRLVGKFGDEYE